MDIPPSQLDQALRMVQRGQMQPDEAARWLLQSSTHDASPHPRAFSTRFNLMSVAQLMRDLGPPPLAIQRDWDQQVARLGEAFSRTFGMPLAELSASDLLIDSENRLSFSPAFVERVAAHKLPSQIPETRQTGQANDVGPALQNRPANNLKADDGSQPSAAAKSHRFPSRRRWLVQLSIYGVAFGLMGLTLYLLLPTADPELAADSAKGTAALQPSSRKSSIFSPSVEPSSRVVPPESEALQEDLADIPLTTTDAISEPDKPAKESRATMGLDSFAGGNWANATELLPEASFDASMIEPGEGDESINDDKALIDPSAGNSRPNRDSPSGLEGNDASSMADDAPDSPTSLVRDKTAIELPPIPTKEMAKQGIESVKFGIQDPKSLTIAFPFDAGLEVTEQQERWSVKESKDQAVLGLFARNEEGLDFRWTEDAISRPVAKQLASGLMVTSSTDGLTSRVYLRPVVNAPAWPIDVMTGDAKAAWPIGVSPPLGPSKLNIEFQLPSTILQTWVQPYNPQKTRSCQSIAEFSLKANPTISIRSRFDVRVGTRVALRIRHAAQLDKNFPWHLISINRVQSAAYQVTDQLARVTREQNELKTIGYKANSSEKRLIAERKALLDQAVSNLQSLSKRLMQYEALLNQLQNHSYLILRLVVDWPDGTDGGSQTIFEMTPRVEIEPETESPAK